MNFNELGDPKYIALETFKKSGEAVNTPVWVAREGDRLYVWTSADSWKVKRIRNNPHVRIAVSDARGNPKSEWVDAQAVVLDDAEAEARQRQRIVAKYGLVFRLFQLAETIRRESARRVAIEIRAK